MTTYTEILKIAQKEQLPCDIFVDYFSPLMDEEGYLQFNKANWSELQKLANKLAIKHNMKPEQYVWAAVDGDNDIVIINGIHQCNVIYHIVCEVPWENDANDTPYIEAEY